MALVKDDMLALTPFLETCYRGRFLPYPDDIRKFGAYVGLDGFAELVVLENFPRPAGLRRG
ncbi:hypothetical protein DENIT_20524 [Pseudomonas veronii]|nr:hypothetical protein DENIT_20524 [Pseudomonas veronii]